MPTLLSNLIQNTKLYQTDQQVKYLHLEAEIDMLLQRITSLMERKEITSTTSDSPEKINLPTSIDAKPNI